MWRGFRMHVIDVEEVLPILDEIERRALGLIEELGVAPAD